MNDIFSKEALQAQDGKEVPVTLENGGPVIGKATLRYIEDNEELVAEFEIINFKVKKFLEEPDLQKD